MQTPLQITAHPASCAICLRFDAEDLTQCGNCLEYRCDECPAFACSCIDDDPMIQALREELIPAAIELKAYTARRTMMGDEYLTPDQVSRLRLLTEIVASLRREINRLDEIRCGEDYSEDAA